jgi:hypothetical protein
MDTHSLCCNYISYVEDIKDTSCDLNCFNYFIEFINNYHKNNFILINELIFSYKSINYFHEYFDDFTFDDIYDVNEVIVESDKALSEYKIFKYNNNTNSNSNPLSNSNLNTLSLSINISLSIIDILSKYVVVYSNLSNSNLFNLSLYSFYNLFVELYKFNVNAYIGEYIVLFINLYIYHNRPPPEPPPGLKYRD